MVRHGNSQQVIEQIGLKRFKGRRWTDASLDGGRFTARGVFANSFIFFIKNSYSVFRRDELLKESLFS